MKHLCIKINESNQNVAYCVNQQREGVKGMFDNTLEECTDLESVNIDAHIEAVIADRNNGEEEIMRLIDEEEINKSGFANQDDQLWLTVGTYKDLVAEVEQEIEYQRNKRKSMNFSQDLKAEQLNL